jgi:hypothetical protein
VCQRTTTVTVGLSWVADASLGQPDADLADPGLFVLLSHLCILHHHQPVLRFYSYNYLEMSSDAAMLSDDDRPIVSKSHLMGHGTHTPNNGNGYVNGAGDQDISMSEDEDAGMPLVCVNSLIRVAYQILNTCRSVAGYYVQVGTRDSHGSLGKTQTACLRRIVQ